MSVQWDLMSWGLSVLDNSTRIHGKLHPMMAILSIGDPVGSLVISVFPSIWRSGREGSNRGRKVTWRIVMKLCHYVELKQVAKDRMLGFSWRGILLVRKPYFGLGNLSKKRNAPKKNMKKTWLDHNLRNIRYQALQHCINGSINFWVHKPHWIQLPGSEFRVPLPCGAK